MNREVPARVLAVLSSSTIRIVLLPGVGLANGGIPTEVSLDLVAPKLRVPNTMLTVTLDGGTITAVEAFRASDEDRRQATRPDEDLYSEIYQRTRSNAYYGLAIGIVLISLALSVLAFVSK